MESSRVLAQRFLEGMTEEEQIALYNDLLALKDVHNQNSKTTFYTFRKIKRASHRNFECRKRTYRYTNKQNDELIINQIHEQHFFKNHYRIQIFFNLQEYDLELVKTILTELRGLRVNGEKKTQPVYA